MTHEHLKIKGIICFSPAYLNQSKRAFSKSSSLSGTDYLLHYNYVPDVLEKQAPHCQGHLDLANEMISDKKCLNGGPIGVPNMEVPRRAVFIFSELEAAEQFVKERTIFLQGVYIYPTIFYTYE